MSLDPAALQVLISPAHGVADEMGAVLRRAAFSPNIKERADCSAALFTADGELLVQAEHIPVHLGSMPASVRAAIDAFAGEPRAGRPDHPQRSVRRRHAPQRHHARRALLSSATGWSGGPPTGRTTPTSAARRPVRSPPTPREIYQEGLRIPPVRLDRRRCGDAARRLAHAGRARRRSRRAGRGQRPRRRAAARRSPDAPFARGARLRRAPHARRAAPRCPTARGRFEDVLDSTGPTPDQQTPGAHRRSLLAIDGRPRHVRLHRHRRAARRATSTRSRRSPSARSRSPCARSIDPTIPANGGALRPVTCSRRRARSSPRSRPAAVGAGNVEVSQRVADVCLGALAEAVP